MYATGVAGVTYFTAWIDYLQFVLECVTSTQSLCRDDNCCSILYPDIYCDCQLLLYCSVCFTPVNWLLLFVFLCAGSCQVSTQYITAPVHLRLHSSRYRVLRMHCVHVVWFCMTLVSLQESLFVLFNILYQMVLRH